MNEHVSTLSRTDAPSDRPRETLDARELPPPQPLQQTLKRLEALDDATVLVQLNDRRPMHLYPILDERGYRYQTVEDDAVSIEDDAVSIEDDAVSIEDDAVVTVIWME